MRYDADKLRVPSETEALPGRSEPMPIPDRHFVNDARIKPPFPEGMRTAIFGLGCFWGAEKKFWQTPGVYSTAVGYAGGHTPNPTYREVCSGLTGHTEVVLVVYDPRQVSYPQLLRVFWENHDPTQGMRQGNDVGTQYRSAVYAYDDEQLAAAETARDEYEQALAARRLRRHHHRDPPGARVLLRRGVPPAVPGQEPRRLLRPGRHRRGLLGRARRGPGLNRARPGLRRLPGAQGPHHLLDGEDLAGGRAAPPDPGSGAGAAGRRWGAARRRPSGRGPGPP